MGVIPFILLCALREHKRRSGRRDFFLPSSLASPLNSYKKSPMAAGLASDLREATGSTYRR